MQIYENLFREEAPARRQRGEIRFDDDGNYVEPTSVGPHAIEVLPTLSGSLRPFLKFIDKHRHKNAAAKDTIVRKKYKKYADLDYITKRLHLVEEDVYGEFWREQNQKSKQHHNKVSFGAECFNNRKRGAHFKNPSSQRIGSENTRLP